MPYVYMPSVFMFIYEICVYMPLVFMLSLEGYVYMIFGWYLYDSQVTSLINQVEGG